MIICYLSLARQSRSILRGILIATELDEVWATHPGPLNLIAS